MRCTVMDCAKTVFKDDSEFLLVDGMSMEIGAEGLFVVKFYWKENLVCVHEFEKGGVPGTKVCFNHFVGRFELV